MTNTPPMPEVGVIAIARAAILFLLCTGKAGIPPTVLPPMAARHLPHSSLTGA
jgi:hypothetical protein